jgi:hypothetical protein
MSDDGRLVNLDKYGDIHKYNIPASNFYLVSNQLLYIL